MKEVTDCHGIMIARGSHGTPWLFAQARAALDGLPMVEEPGPKERFEVCIRHARNAIAFEENQERAVFEFRKHLGWYAKGFPGARQLRIELFKADGSDNGLLAFTRERLARTAAWEAGRDAASWAAVLDVLPPDSPVPPVTAPDWAPSGVSSPQR